MRPYGVEVWAQPGGRCKNKHRHHWKVGPRREARMECEFDLKAERHEEACQREMEECKFDPDEYEASIERRLWQLAYGGD